MNKRLILIIFDGFGVSPQTTGNAVAFAKMPNYDYLVDNFPKTSLSASEEEVGLLWGTRGSSEIGHINIGSGRVVWHDLSRVFRSIEDKSFFKNPVILEACKNVNQNNKALHIIGLTSDGAVHSHIEHLYALLKIAREQKVNKIFVHIITDGRDTAPQKILEFLPELNKQLNESGTKVASVSGRYFAMDRDQRWDRTKRAYEAIAKGVGQHASSLEEAINSAYRRGEKDEFIQPTIIVDNNQKSIATVSDGDSIIFFNIRPDRAKQITQLFVKEFKELFFATMTNFEVENPQIHIIFPQLECKNSLAEVIANHGLKQLHIAETEKYAHVTYFFNVGREKPYKGEDHIIIPSPHVATYDKKPEMSAQKVTEKLTQAIKSKKYDFIVANYANPDMVGHTGVFQAAVKACEVVDECLGKVMSMTLKNDYTLVLTADHGNAEQMIDPKTGSVQKEHTANPVPFIVAGKDNKKPKPISNEEKLTYLMQPPIGVLADIAPTVLNIMGLKIPSEMTGMSLLNNLS